MAHLVMSKNYCPLDLISAHHSLVLLKNFDRTLDTNEGYMRSIYQRFSPKAQKSEDCMQEARAMHVQLNENAYYLKAGLPILCDHLPCRAGNQLLTIY